MQLFVLYTEVWCVGFVRLSLITGAWTRLGYVQVKRS